MRQEIETAEEEQNQALMRAIAEPQNEERKLRIKDCRIKKGVAEEVEGRSAVVGCVEGNKAVFYTRT